MLFSIGLEGDSGEDGIVKVIGRLIAAFIETHEMIDPGCHLYIE
jgi:hypothetical protein